MQRRDLDVEADDLDRDRDGIGLDERRAAFGVAGPAQLGPAAPAAPRETRQDDDEENDGASLSASFTAKKVHEGGVCDRRLLPLRQVARVLDRHEARARHRLEQRAARLEGHGRILLPPDDEHRPWMRADALDLLALVDGRVGHELRQARTPEAAVLHLNPIPVRPVGKTLRVQKVAELLVRPSALGDESGDEVPQRTACRQTAAATPAF